MSDNKQNEGKQKADIGNFTVEFGNTRGQQITVKTLRRTYRGTFALSDLHRRRDVNGKAMTGRPVGDVMSQIPDTPGMRLEIDVSTRKVREYDPLADDPETLDRACRILSRAKGGVEIKMRAQESRTHELDEHTFKTLLRELVQIKDNGCAKVVSGKLPTHEDIRSLPGRFLHDPWASDRAFRFEDEYEKWLGERKRVGAAV